MKRKLEENVVEKIFDGDHPDYELVEEGEWTDDGKSSWAINIVQDQDGDYWRVDACRYGNHYSDYDYSYSNEIVEVEKRAVTTIQWAPARDEDDSV